MDLTRVSVYYLSSDGGDWALYLQSKLNTEEYALDTILNDLMCDSSFHTKSARLNVFLITPHFLDSYVYFRYLENFEQRNCILILTGIELCELVVEANHRDCMYVLSWITHELKGDEESVRGLMIKIIEVYEGHLDQPSNSQPEDGDGGPSDRDSELYDQLPPTSPRHVNEGLDIVQKDGDEGSSDRECEYDELPPKSPRQVNKVLDIVQKANMVYILLERPPERSIIVQFPGYSITPECLNKAAVYTFDCRAIESTSFAVVSNKTKISQGTLSKRRESELYCTLATPYVTASTQTDAVSEPGSGTDKNKDDDDDNDDKDGNDDEYDKKENETFDTSDCQGRSKLEIINQILEEEAYPEKLLCKALGIKNDVAVLDDTLAGMIEGVEALRKLSVPSELHTTEDDSLCDLALFFSAKSNLIAKSNNSDQAVWPSLLHFGAQYNLKKFCTVLTSNRLVHHACAVPNKHGLMPHELAQKYGHTELAQMLAKIPTNEPRKNEGKYDSGFDAESYISHKLSASSETEELDTPQPPSAHSEAKGRGHEYANVGPAVISAGLGNVIDEDEALNDILKYEHQQPMKHYLTESRQFAPAPMPAPPPTPTGVLLPKKQHKKAGFFKLFGHSTKKPTRARRFSEPTVPSHVVAQLNKNQEEVIQRKKLIHYSKEPVPIPEIAPPMCTGARSKKAGSGKDSEIHVRSKGRMVQRTLLLEQDEMFGKRKSIRITHAMKDTSLKGPKLPPRNRDTKDTALDKMVF